MKTNVRVLKDMPEVKLIRKQLGPFTAGDEVELWAWEAAALERHGIAVPIQKPTPAELRKLILAEERSSELAPLPDNFYPSVAREVSALQAAGDLEKAGGLKDKTLALTEIRLPKLVRLALSPEGPSGLSIEEHFLINRLADVLDGWSRRLSDLFEKAGEEVGKNERGRSIQHVAGDETDIQKPRVPAPELHTGGTATQG